MEVFRSNVTTYTSNQLQPLQEHVRQLTNAIVPMLQQIAEAEKAVSRLKYEQNLISLMSRAQAFDNEAFLDLNKIAQGTNEYASLARSMVRKVQRDLLLDKG